MNFQLKILEVWHDFRTSRYFAVFVERSMSNPVHYLKPTLEAVDFEIGYSTFSFPTDRVLALAEAIEFTEEQGNEFERLFATIMKARLVWSYKLREKAYGLFLEAEALAERLKLPQRLCVAFGRSCQD